MMFYIPPNTKANSSKMQHLLSPTQTMAQGGTTGLGRQLMELFHEISELDKSKLTSGISINFANLNLPFHFAALHLNDGSRPFTRSGIQSRQKPEEKKILKHFQTGKKGPLVCDPNLWRWRARAYLQNARVKREDKYKKMLKITL